MAGRTVPEYQTALPLIDAQNDACDVNEVVAKSKRISRLLKIGERTNGCVVSTVRDATKLGYDVELLKDCTGSSSHEHREREPAAIADGFATIRSSEEPQFEEVSTRCVQAEREM